ncbi:hypothetical protein CVT24_011748 [Panaeolus cyanescens]|uniref:Putative lipoate-protein ligase A n=1 Tax=Panaeolus cyanescens TaxID=181874 RepID=A0A409VYL6_9AGAR|nr:hypothetical protein CVT24_011748 [Panaeolus cyanescens]
MLINSRLETLGGILRPEKLNILTKGVESVRSPVCNLIQYAPHLNHQAFTDAVVESFKSNYGLTPSIQTVHEEDGASVKYIQNGIKELQSWEWKYGQSPEFTQRLEKTFSWGTTVADIKCRHGIIEEVRLNVIGGQPPIPQTETALQFISHNFKGQKYGFIDLDRDSFPTEDAWSNDIKSWLAKTGK